MVIPINKGRGLRPASYEEGGKFNLLEEGEQRVLWRNRWMG